MTIRPRRRWFAGAVILCWVAGLVMLARRRHGLSDAELLAMGALHIAPATYYYAVLQDGQPVGSAVSTIDTSTAGFTARESLRARALIAGDSQSVTASSVAYLSRGFALDSFAISLDGDAGPFRLTGIPKGRAGVLLPTLAPLGVMLSRAPQLGSTSPWWIYNPVSRTVERVTIRIAAESLITVVDSARFDSVAHVWVAAHSDTVRAWKLVTPSRAITSWVDSQGRIVAASEPGGASLQRTAHEIAVLNPKLLRP